MKIKDILIRNSDKKVFIVTELSHWSSISSEDGTIDLVKWYGCDMSPLAKRGGTPIELYVGSCSGETYRLQN